MKTIWLLAIGLTTAMPLPAQLFTPESLTGAALGGIAGAVIGHNTGRHGGEGAAIGAGAGWLLGTLVHRDRVHNGYYGPSYSSSFYAPGYNYGGTYTPAPAYYYRRPNYALGGAALGAIGGAVIGHNSGRHGAEGALIGAGAGLLLGSVAEANARSREDYASQQAAANYYYSVPAPAASAPAPAVTETQAPPVRTAARRPASNMASANALFGR